MKQFIIDDKEAGRRLDQYLHKLLPEAGTSFVYKMLRKKNITVNKKKASGNERLNAGDSIEIFFSEETFNKLSGGNISNSIETHISTKEYETAFKVLDGIDIVYEDQDFIFVNKPAGVLSQKAEPTDVSLNEWLVGYLLNKGELTEELLKTFKPGFCNRLDRNTRGLVIGGKSLNALRALSAGLKDRTIHKFYYTEAVGSPDASFPITSENFWTTEAVLFKDKKANQVYVFADETDAIKLSAKKNGVKSNKLEHIMTGFRLIEQKEGYMCVEVELHTGKSHQIRAHLAYLGHPIMGDPKYGDIAVINDTNIHSYQELKAYKVVFPEIAEFPNISMKEFIC